MFPHWNIILVQNWVFQADLPLLRFKPQLITQPHTQPLTHFHCIGMGERIWRVKMTKTYGLRKGQFITQRKAAHPGKAEQRIPLSLPLGRLAFSYPQESRLPGNPVPITLNTNLKKENPITPSVPHLPPPSLHFIYWAWGHIIWNIPLISLCQLHRLCPSQPPVWPRLLAGVGGEKQKRLWLCARAAQQ